MRTKQTNKQTLQSSSFTPMAKGGTAMDNYLLEKNCYSIEWQ
ncbi:MAG: hypothetical protein ABF991_05670 [Liquorilactobacillus hordei]